MKLIDLVEGKDGAEVPLDDWVKKGYSLPKYDRNEVKKNTVENPEWLHFGAGNIFRAFTAESLQQMLNEGSYKKGIIVAESFDYEIIEKAYQPYDGMSLSVVLKANGTIEKIVVGSVVESLVANVNISKDYKRIIEIFENPSLQMVSFTITEKGYSLVDAKGNVFGFVLDGFETGPNGEQKHLMGIIASFCYRRFKKCMTPIALVSMDNCSHNGDKLKEGVMEYVNQWHFKNLVEKEFVDYMSDSNKVSFPWSMIDKITPRPDENVVEMLKKDGFEDTDLIITDKNTYTAPFVNSEETGYLVIEDVFPNGRPMLEKAGILFTKRETVDQVERMKVCTCLNPLHTALAIFGCLLGYTKIYEEMKDDDLRTLVKKMCYQEGMPVVVDPGIIDPREFAKTVLTLRLPNPFMPDAPQRIATDTSQKLPIRFGETIKCYVERDDLNVEDLTLIPLVIAGWCRYLMGVDDEGNVFTQSPDPMLDTLKPMFDGVKLGEIGDVHTLLKKILQDKKIFALDLYKIGLGEKIENFFLELSKAPGAVRSTLQAKL